MRVGAAAVLLAASVLLSRALGYLREAVLANQVGVSAQADAYRAAFQIPDMLNYFLAGGALSIAFSPLYTRALRERGSQHAERLFATVLGTTGALAILFTAAMWWWAEPLIALQFADFDAETRALAVRLTRIVLPAQIFFVSGGIVRAVLMARGRFGAQAAAPLIYNGAIIAGGLALGPRLGVEGFAWGALVGPLIGSLIVPLVDAWGRVRVRIRIAPFDRELLAYLVVAAPLMLGLSLLTVDEWYDRWFGNRLGEGVIASLGYARQLMQAPVAVVGQAIAAAALPVLAQLWSAGRREELERVLLRTLQAGLALALLAGAGMFALAQPIVQLVYQHGAFTRANSEVVAGLLSVFCFAVPGWVAQQIASRAFFARGDTWRPMLLSTAVALAAIPLYLALGERLGPSGLALAGALAMSTNALLTLGLARRLHGSPPLGRLLATGTRAALVAAAAAAAAQLVQRPPGDAPRALLNLTLGAAAFGAIGLAGVWAVGDAVMRDGVRRVLRRAGGVG